MQHSVVIGLEVHVQLQTKTKLFCGCLNLFNPDNPNVQTCPVCLGLPGALPVMNRRAFELALQTALALRCDISSFTKWDRKQYYYPDLPKAYQISQYDLPFSHDGGLDIVIDDQTREIRHVGIIRAHLEEDAGKNLHDESGRGQDSKVDLNRCGTPLVEIVTEPDLRSPAEARRCLEEIRLLLTYLEVSDCNMQEGSLRCDANINLLIQTDDGHEIATPITEIKNLNSFRNVELACESEIKRQLKEYEKTGIKKGDPGGEKETRGWDANRGVTFSQRSKEEAADYRYFPDPDLLPVSVEAAAVEAVRESLCEFPADRRARLEAAWQLSPYDAAVIIDQGRRFADYFEEAANLAGDGKLAANWCTQEALRELNERQVSIEQFVITPELLGNLLRQITDRKITTKSAREVFATLLADADLGSHLEPDRIDRIIESKGLRIVNDAGKLESVIEAILAENPDVVVEVRGGKQQAVNRLIGAAMKQLKGADANAIRQMFLDRIGS